MSAATAAASRTAAPPVSVRRNSRSGVSRLRAHAVRPVNGDGRPFGSPLLLVALHHLRPSDVGCVRVATGVAERAALAQQIPALVERDLHCLQALSVFLGRVARRLSLPQRVLLGHELLDRSVDLRILHQALLRYRVALLRYRVALRRFFCSQDNRESQGPIPLWAGVRCGRRVSKKSRWRLEEDCSWQSSDDHEPVDDDHVVDGAAHQVTATGTVSSTVRPASMLPVTRPSSCASPSSPKTLSDARLTCRRLAALCS